MESLREKHISLFSLVASPHKGKNWLSHTQRIPHRGSLTNYVDGKGRVGRNKSRYATITFKNKVSKQT